MTEDHNQKMIELMDQGRQKREANRIHKLINSDNLTPRKATELRRLLTNSVISRNGLIDLVCTMRQSLISPLGEQGTANFLNTAITMHLSIHGKNTGGKRTSKKIESRDMAKVKKLYLKHYPEIKEKKYVGIFKEASGTNKRTGGLKVFANEQALNYGLSAKSIKSYAPKWRRQSMTATDTIN
jgi:hypothetical protein